MSSTPTRDERLARQVHDGGDPDDEVHYNGNYSSSKIYHDDRDCRTLWAVDDEDVDSDTRRAMQLRWYAPCTRCVLEGRVP